MIEEWKDIPGYKGLYKINNNGEIISYSRKKPIIKKSTISKNGYCRVSLYKNKISKIYLIHRLVALVFLENPNNYSQINHKDENKLNNNVDNLEWCDSKYNLNYGTRTKRIADKLKVIHKGKHFSPRTEFKKGMGAMKIYNSTNNKIYSSMQEASKDTGVPTSNICNCCKGRIKKAGGYKWEYYLVS